MKSFTFANLKLFLLLVALLGFSSAKAQGLLFTPGSVNFTNTTAGSVSAVQAVSVQYFGPPFQATITNIVPPANSAFAVSSNTCTVGTYQDFSQCSLEFTFTAPNTAGSVSDVFRFVTAEFGNLEINLSGSSLGASIAANPVPTTSGWVLLALSALLSSAAFVTARRRS